ADKALGAAFRSLTETGADAARRDYGTRLRDGAAIITLASETGGTKADVAKLVDVVAKAFALRSYTSTQEQAWMLLAARALAEEAGSTRLIVAGQAHQGQLLRSFTLADLKDGVSISNEGDNPVDAIVSVVGAALTPEPPAAKGMTLERLYYTLDGK